MREIKFRVWDKENNEWVTGSQWQTETKLNYESRFLTKRNTYVLMQYTGMKDVDGVEIYEGDKDRSGNVVEWGRSFADERFGWRIKASDNSGWSFDFRNFEVIGNIYEGNHDKE